MSGKLGFGYGKERSNTASQQENRPYFTNTGYSSINGTTLNLDPSIRTLQEEALGRSRGLMGNLSQGTSDYLTRTMGIRDQLSSGASPYIQARVNPVIQAGATRQGQLQSDIGLRQTGGSSFADQSLNNLSFDTARQIGDASALANADVLSAQTGLDKDMLNAIIGRVQVEQNINGFTNEIAQQRLKQEIESFKLGTNQQGSSTTTGTSASISGQGGSGNAFGGRL